MHIHGSGVQTVEVWLNLPVAEAFPGAGRGSASAVPSVVSCQLTEGMSEITRAVVVIASAEPLDFEAAAAGPAAVTLLFDGLPVRRWTLAVWRAAFTSIEDGTLRYEVELCDRLRLLELCTSTRKFRHQSARDIVSTVLGEQGIGCAWRTERSPAKRSFCVQYRETGLAFVRRLLEQEGIFYTVDPDGAVIFGDASGASPRVEPESRFELVEVAGALDASVPGVREIRKVARVASGSVTVNDFNWKKPGLSLAQSCAAGRDADLTIYDYPAGYREPDEGARIARTRLEAKRVEASSVEGLGNVAGFAPARVFTFGSDAGQAFAGEYLLVHVEHRVENTPHSDDQESGDSRGTTTYVNRFRAIPRAAPFRPAASAPRPTVAGSHTAMVRGPAGAEIHTDAHGRFKAQFHWDREASGSDADSRWIRMMQEPATSMTLARVGWEVSIGYVHGDPERPIGLSRSINGVMPPAYAQPSNKNVMTIKTPSSPGKGGYSELKLDDTAAAMRLDLRAERDLVGLVKNDKAERIGNSEAHLARASLSHEVGKDQSVTIGASSTTACEGSYQLVVAGDRTKSVGGNETIEVGKEISVATSGNETERIGKVRLTIDGSIGAPSGDELAGAAKQAGMGAAQGAAMSAISGGGLSGAASAAGGSLSSMVPASSFEAAAALGTQGGITRTAANGVQRVVGGAFVSVAANDIKIDAGKGYAETVVGAKLTFAKDGIAQKVEGAMALTVGGALFRTAKGDMTSTAKNIKVRVGGGAAFSSEEKLTISGKVITIEAGTKLAINAGAEGEKKLAIDLGPGEMVMKGGPVKLESAGKIVVTGCSINLTVAEKS